jgi:hypothetical protein
MPPSEWGARPYWPQGSGYGEWKRRKRGELVFVPAPPGHEGLNG